jgi:multidrug efflux system outer membrane protein
VLRSVQLALQADVAQTYFALRATDENCNCCATPSGCARRAQICSRGASSWATSASSMLRAKTELSVARNDAIALERQRAQLEHGLALLLGKPPAALSLAPAQLASALPVVPAGLPSSLLERRPDIASAQRTMAAANARIGVAKSAFFPLLRLTAQGGLESSSLATCSKWSRAVPGHWVRCSARSCRCR